MPPIKSFRLGHISLGGHAKDPPSGDVASDGRVRVHFHDSPRRLVTWFERAFAREPAAGPKAGKPEQPSGLRPTSCLAVLPDVEKPASAPRLNVAIHVVGSRGDIQPFIPIAHLLMRPPYGHRVRLCTHPVFKDFVESQGVEFFSIGGDPEALMAYMVKNPGLLPGRDSLRGGEIGKRRKEMFEIINGCWRSCIEAGDGTGGRVTAANVEKPDDLFLADAIIANPPSMAHIHCAEKLGIPLHIVFTMPWSPTRTFPHPLASMSYGDTDASIANYLSFMMMELLTWQGLGDLINRFRTQTLQLDPVSPMWGYQLLARLRVPHSYLWSEALIPKPSDWGPHISITGFSFLPLANSYTPPPDLVKFLDNGPTPIYIGFGSIVVDDPQALTRLVFSAVELAGVRAIVSKGWGGFGDGVDVPEGVYLIGNCPHDWLFQHVSAVVHHGGAGTTAAGIAAGRPTVVVPFFGDQPFWGQMMARAGAGPKTVVPYKELTAERLAESITYAQQPDVREVAQQMAQGVARENGAGSTAVDIHTRLDMDELRCDLCPARLAVWQHKRSGAHLSGFAACALVDRGLIRPDEVRLLRHRSWYVDEGAEAPVIGLIATATGLVSAVSNATSDFSDRIHNPAPPPQSLLRARRDSKQLSKQISHLAKRRPSAQPQEQLPNRPTAAAEGHDGNGDDDDSDFQQGVLRPDAAITPEQMQIVALKLATKSLHDADPEAATSSPSQTLHNRRKEAWRTKEQGRNGRAYYVARATGRYVCDMTKAGAKAPVALFYNVANGFHNVPSHGLAAVPVRRRDPITGLGTGAKAAGKGFALGIWDGLSGVVRWPYKGAEKEGFKGFGKGLISAWLGLYGNIGAAIFGVPGYTLKGLEKELDKHRLTKLKAELLLIRVRQGMDDFRHATPAEKDEVVNRWKAVITR